MADLNHNICKEVYHIDISTSLCKFEYPLARYIYKITNIKLNKLFLA